MPSTSGKQHRFMAAVANNPSFAKRAGVPQSVGEEFIKADKGRKFSDKGSEMKGMKKMGMGGLSAGHKQADGIAKKGKTRGMEVKMASGGLAAGHKQADGVAKKGKTKTRQIKMAAGGMKGC